MGCARIWFSHEIAAIKQQLQPFAGCNFHVKTRSGHNPLIGLQIAVEHHLAGLGALHPKIVRHLAFAPDALNFRPDDICNPVQRVSLSDTVSFL